MKRIVVIFGSENPEWCDLNHCPSQAFGPFDTEADAHAFMATWPPQWHAHCLMISDPSLVSK